MPIRILRYHCDLYQQWYQQHPKQKLPLIYSIVVYNGDVRYYAPTQLLDLFAKPKLAQEQLLNPFQLIDLPHIADNHLPTTTWAHALLGLMKYVHRDDLADFIYTSLRADIHQLEFNRGNDFVVSMLHYTLERGDLAGINQYKGNCSP